MDRGIIATASELFEARHYPGVVALITDALEAEPDCVPLLLVRARAHMGLRRDLDAQADLRDIIRLDPQCSLAYRLLGELAARRNENESAAIFFREALRLDPGDHEADTWLAIVQATARPAAAAKHPAPAAAAGRFPTARESQPRFAKGTRSPDDEPVTARMARVPEAIASPGFAGARSAPEGSAEWIAPERSRRMVRPIAPDVQTDREITPLPPPPSAPYRGQATGSSPVLGAYVDDEARTARDDGARGGQTHPYRGGGYHARELVAYREPDAALARGSDHALAPTAAERALEEPRTLQGAQPVRRPLSQPNARPASEPRASRPATEPPVRRPIPEMPGFGEYLVSTGILSVERLRAAQAYQRSMRVQLATAIVTLGLATPQRIEWAAVAHQAQLARNS